ncbi:MAG: tRNA (adenosine(37)-N6)-threonylcarbamoyltransferase complex ATPase subunit type 1 TsaE [Elusimicrobiales bacterium]
MRTAAPKVSSISDSAAATRRLAARLARRLRGGEIIFLRGPIGAGKTVFVQGLAKALGVKTAPSSASFNLMRQYRSPKLRLFHIDLFRLNSGETANLGLETLLEDPAAVIAAEWPDPAADFLPQDRLEIEIKLLAGGKRRITAAARGPLSGRLLS